MNIQDKGIERIKEWWKKIEGVTKEKEEQTKILKTMIITLIRNQEINTPDKKRTKRPRIIRTIKN
jgi:hypothetical protein